MTEPEARVRCPHCNGLGIEFQSAADAVRGGVLHTNSMRCRLCQEFGAVDASVAAEYLLRDDPPPVQEDIDVLDQVSPSLDRLMRSIGR